MRFAKTVLAISLSIVLFVAFSTNAIAALVTIEKNGDVLVNVLSETDNVFEIPSIDDVVDVKLKENLRSFIEDKKITLVRRGKSVKLNISTETDEKSLDVTNFDKNIIEIKARPKIEKIEIGLVNNKFAIKQRGLVAETSFQIEIDPDDAGITLNTPTGRRFLAILPSEAVDTLFRARIINDLASKRLLLYEEIQGGLIYVVSGKRIINLFDLVEYEANVDATLSATTGEIISVDQPTWLDIFGFLFT